MWMTQWTVKRQVLMVMVQRAHDKYREHMKPGTSSVVTQKDAMTLKVMVRLQQLRCKSCIHALLMVYCLLSWPWPCLNTNKPMHETMSYSTEAQKKRFAIYEITIPRSYCGNLVLGLQTWPYSYTLGTPLVVRSSDP